MPIISLFGSAHKIFRLILSASSEGRRGALPDNNGIFYQNNIYFEVNEISFKGYMITKILHLLSFHMIFNKFVKGMFNKFHMK